MNKSTEELAEQLQALAWHDYLEEDPMTGERYTPGGRVLIEAAVRLLEQEDGLERYRQVERDIQAVVGKERGIKDAAVRQHFGMTERIGK